MGAATDMKLKRLPKGATDALILLHGKQVLTVFVGSRQECEDARQKFQARLIEVGYDLYVQGIGHVSCAEIFVRGIEQAVSRELVPAIDKATKKS